MKTLAYAVMLVAGGVGGLVTALVLGGGNDTATANVATFSLPIGLVVSGACAAFVAWLSKESK
jgi:hypothetical protein